MKYFLTGISGQLGHFLTKFLLEEGHQVSGMVRRSSSPNTSRIEQFLDRIELLSGDLTDESSLITCLEKSQPDVVLNLGAMSFVAVSWIQPELTMNVNALGPIRLLESIRKVNPKIRFVQMSSSEQFGKVQDPVQSEKTKFFPRSIYGVSKCAAHYAVVNYRESYNMFASNVISFNYESIMRGSEFISKKITEGIRKIIKGDTKELRLGNLAAERDWSAAPDVARAVYMVSRHSEPDDFVVCSGEKHSVKELLELAFGYVGLNYKDYIKIDQEFFRPAEVDVLLGDYSKIKNTLGWEPKIKFKELITTMLDHELSDLR